ncbi:MAG: hypothetical protein DLM53_02355 [Candidatus Eremiobacter antarcticus]|nr:hypothetical protein [Candidatus Eremiobacteraeota bacterium]MBC5808250.1 hypothetical protein [Candidatus Eremiobacteraeota bacterium]PZR63633.1 MAG: hypothetical protein DLM53_02355 [Candidatus Eremiobacter sp. RRmetagenome_bin22]
MLLSIDGTFLIQIANFILFWVLLNYLFVAPTRRAIEARQRYVSGLYSEAADFAAQAAALRAQAEDILNVARRETQERMRAAAAQASEEAHGIEQQALNEAAATVQLAHGTVAAERAEALAKQQRFVVELARSMVERATAVEHA